MRPALPNLVFNVDAVLAAPLHSTQPNFLQRPRPVNKHDLIAAVAEKWIAECVTIIGIPLGLANFKLVPISLMPLGSQIVSTARSVD